MLFNDEFSLIALYLTRFLIFAHIVKCTAAFKWARLYRKGELVNSDIFELPECTISTFMQLGHTRVKKSYSRQTRGDLTVILIYAILLLVCSRISLRAVISVIESLLII